MTSLSDGSILDFTQDNWSPIESCCYINVKEIMAVKFALFSFLPNASNSIISVRCDNSSVVTYLNRMGGLGSEALNFITDQIWHWCIDRGNWLLCEHVPGTENCYADHLSRFFNDNMEWSLVPKIFDQLCAEFFPPK